MEKYVLRVVVLLFFSSDFSAFATSIYSCTAICSPNGSTANMRPHLIEATAFDEATAKWTIYRNCRTEHSVTEIICKSFADCSVHVDFSTAADEEIK